MKQFFLSAIFFFLYQGVFAQYGRLEPLDPNNINETSVLRTHQDTIKRLLKSADKIEKKKGAFIERLEKDLDLARYSYLAKRISYIDVNFFLKAVDFLEKNGVAANYYVEEYFVYFPKKYTK